MTYQISTNSIAQPVVLVGTDGEAYNAGGAGGGLTDAQLRATPVPVSGTVAVTGVATAAKQDTGNASLATLAGALPMTNAQYLANNRATIVKTSVSSAATSTQLLAANANRKSLAIVNTDANILYVDVSGGTADNAGIPIATGGYWAPDGAMPTNAITGVWASDGAGAATVFEG